MVIHGGRHVRDDHRPDAVPRWVLVVLLMMAAGAIAWFATVTVIIATYNDGRSANQQVHRLGSKAVPRRVQTGNDLDWRRRRSTPRGVSCQQTSRRRCGAGFGSADRGSTGQHSSGLCQPASAFWVSLAGDYWSTRIVARGTIRGAPGTRSRGRASGFDKHAGQVSETG